MPDLSDLSLKRKECPKCGAVWINDQHYWATGAKGNELDLAGLVCNTANSELCVNPQKGKEGGDTWEKRLRLLNSLDKRIKDTDSPQWDAGISGKDN